MNFNIEDIKFKLYKIPKHKIDENTPDIINNEEKFLLDIKLKEWGFIISDNKYYENAMIAFIKDDDNYVPRSIQCFIENKHCNFMDDIKLILSDKLKIRYFNFKIKATGLHTDIEWRRKGIATFLRKNLLNYLKFYYKSFSTSIAFDEEAIKFHTKWVENFNKNNMKTSGNFIKDKNDFEIIIDLLKI